ncbi:hypothetical protein [Hyphomicrobium sp. MC8b]|uniref:hypothetical protein n=1 Tax=Hyphomicrobium sp. MC8b TaxID=300273 RepID=UPI00391AC228
MRYVFLVVALCIGLVPRVEAEETGRRAAAVDRVQIVEDDEAGEIRFLIDGKLAARLDAEGFHVPGKVSSENSFVLPVIRDPAIVPVKPGKGAP